jgi:hypothetical protein
VLVLINTCPLTANLAVSKFVVGGEVLMDNTPDDTMKKVSTVTLQVCEFKLIADQLVNCVGLYFYRILEMFNLPKSQPKHKITKRLELTR